jgi:hypothetical protein
MAFFALGDDNRSDRRRGETMRRMMHGLCILGVMLFVLGCSTSIPVTVTKPAEINMSGNRVIAVPS